MPSWSWSRTRTTSRSGADPSWPAPPTAGHDTAVLCATRGEAGESRVQTDDLATVREAELRAAAEILGVGVVQLLDHSDSGMTGEPGPGTLAATEPSLIAAEVRAVIEGFRPMSLSPSTPATVTATM